jgi:hypothetical protein
MRGRLDLIARVLGVTKRSMRLRSCSIFKRSTTGNFATDSKGWNRRL